MKWEYLSIKMMAISFINQMTSIQILSNTLATYSHKTKTTNINTYQIHLNMMTIKHNSNLDKYFIS